MKDGYITEYGESGKPVESGTYKMNIKTGTWSFYDKYGSRIRDQYFKNGRPDGKITEYFMSGKISMTGYYEDTKKIGQWIYYNEEGKVVQKMFFDSNGRMVKGEQGKM